MKHLPPSGAVARFIELRRDLPQGLPPCPQEFGQLCRLPVSLVLARVTLHGLLPLGNHGCRKVLRAAQLRTPCFLGRKGILGPFGNRLPLVLSDDRKKPHSKGIGIGHIAADKVYARIAQGEDEPRIPRQPVQFGNKQRRPHPPGLGDGRQQLRPVVLLATLNFHVLGAELSRVRDEGAHRGPLRFEP